jgi:hypothetical protein
MRKFKTFGLALVAASTLLGSALALAVTATECPSGYVYRVRPSGNHDRDPIAGGSCVLLDCKTTTDSNGQVVCMP